MSVLVRGFKIPIADEPKTFLTHFNDDGTAEMVALGYPQKRYSMVEVPPHGRLVDADALLRDFPIRADHYDKEHGNKHFVYGVETVMDYVGEMPTIIEREE